MRLTIVSVGYPLAAAGPGAVGGAEQVMAALDAALVARGARSIVVAPQGSQAAGELVATRAEPPPFDDAAKRRAQARHRIAIEDLLRARAVDLLHMHGVDFETYLPAAAVPVVVTLHGPRCWYSAEALRPRANVWLHCVSAAQHRDFAGHPRLLAPIDNGVAAPAWVAAVRKRDYALVLSRIAPEKGVHVALDAARRAGVDLLIAGEAFGYPEHLRYFETAVAPLLDERRALIGPVQGARKWRLLAEARCVLLAPQIAETSSLVAREALAAGTPVIALPAGALPSTIEHGRTGYLVDDAAAMAAAIRRVDALDPADCRRAAAARFPAERMIESYLALYRAAIERATARVA